MMDPTQNASVPSRQRPTAIPRSTLAPLTRKATAPLAGVSSSSATKKSATDWNSSSQEVPLLMDPYEAQTRGLHQVPSVRNARQFSRSAMTSLDSESDAIFGIVMPPSTSASRPADLPPRLIPELQALAASSSRHPEVFNKSGSSISSPSTWLSSSTSPWSASTTTTPISWSSASPGIVQQMPSRTLGKRSQALPSHITTWEETPDVPNVPVSYLMPTNIGNSGSKRPLGQGRKPLDTEAPTPPPRTSSAKTSLSRSSSKSHKLRQPTPPSSEMERSPLTRRTQRYVEDVGDSLEGNPLAHAHGQLQQSLEQVSSNHTFSETSYSFGHGDRSVLTAAPRAFATPSSGTLAMPFGDTKDKEGRVDDQIVAVGGTDPVIQSSPGRVGKLSRLGFFGRRPKSPGKDVERSPRKLQRRGPVAGTGHEGYGRYGRRGRKSSEENNSANSSESERSVSSTRRRPFFSTKDIVRSSSRHKRGSQSDLDEFASTRMRPIPIVGGSEPCTRSDSGVGSDISSRTISPPNSAMEELAMPLQSEDSFNQNVLDYSHTLKRDNLNPARRPTLAIRRSQRFGTGTEAFNIPTPIRTEQLSAPVYVTSQTEGGTSALAASMSTRSTTPELSRVDDVYTTTKDKKSRKLRWNIFRKKEAEMKPERSAMPSSVSPEEMAVAISTVTSARPAPYYAVIDSENEVNTSRRPGDFLTEVVESPQITPLNGPYETETAEIDQNQESFYDEVFLPAAPSSPPHFFVPVSESPDEVYTTPDLVPALQPGTRGGFLLSPAYDGAKPRTTPTPEAPEFLRFPSRQTSERSASSSSDGFASILGPPLALGIVDGTHRVRVVQPSDAYVPQSPTLDEVWNEYDDFIDHVMSPSEAIRTAKLNTEAMTVDHPGDRSQVRLWDRDALRSRLKTPDRGPRAVAPSFVRRPIVDEPGMIPATEPSAALPLTSRSTYDPEQDSRLSRSRMVSALHSSTNPISPFSFRDFLTEYENHPRSSQRISGHRSTSTGGRSLDHLPTTLGATEVHNESRHQENVALLDVVERSKDPVGQSEIHYASLMVAKWLSFGRVLFSPAHDEVQRISERHVLVIDGLGNEDWSIYCAVTYEAQRVFVHDLQEKSNTKRSDPPQTSQHTSGNHRRAELPSFYERFPFQSAYFCAVVVRFPPAMAEAKLKNLMAECRRVLQPGGYIELMLLDLDIVNMGVQTRRAVRELKFKMTTADKHISLRPIIDNVQNVLGARGFSNISRCVVGVPVAGRPSKPGDSPSSSRSSGGSDPFAGPGSGDQRHATASPRMSFGQGRRGANLSLNDLIADHSDNADAKIGKIVSRTARTWWQHCFEASVISNGNLSTSIFANKHVLGECRSRGSSFKMLIAYAQRPVFETRRRTMSESAVPAMATAGAHKHIQTAVSGSNTA
ncbi:hypothetical protein LTR10_019009 [Elasticomyces elasticus]|uniref:Methyltransferase type 11 domain-containing protein n=1 Tax=Exophiala sideris TaxID=1016849 RepID=A0ABR0J2Z9_9EURO|nr:hypothetical protein LTR10_019009 [Elasticomyces elasticus]KAK5026625.1 hypothetical protein LTS07_007559 [Exophiala sideris]KAK5033635.1 hypothetical protein LTR13_006687 [Exophiala sideris]KAK5055458.1 hypothetical protein LTR69_008291 [Exophiala sideris]KAK5176456.1 hypothetical protein LTR44_011017 [Eurotiomycetes sp. CCFEE 6388]